MFIFVSLILVLISTVIIAKACDGFETAADYLGRNMSEGVKGASINAIGSSMPELFATFVFLFFFSDTSGFAGGIGTTAGSAVFNTMIIPAASILAALKMFKISSITVSKKVILRDGLMLIGAEIILIVIIGETLNWWHGMILMLLYLAYVGYMFASMKNEPEHLSEVEDKNDKEDKADKAPNRVLSFFKLDLGNVVIGENEMTSGIAWKLLTLSTSFIALACYILVYACEMFGHAIGIHGYFVAVILAAAASSVPDTILSIKDAKKGNYDDAVSNALGSNIFDICFALGLPLFLYTLIYGEINMPVDMANNIFELRLLLLVLTIATFLIFLTGRSLGKTKAYSLVALYGVFFTYIINSAYQIQWIQPMTDFLNQTFSCIQ